MKILIIVGAVLLTVIILGIFWVLPGTCQDDSADWVIFPKTVLAEFETDIDFQVIQQNKVASFGSYCGKANYQIQKDTDFSGVSREEFNSFIESHEDLVALETQMGLRAIVEYPELESGCNEIIAAYSSEKKKFEYISDKGKCFPQDFPVTFE